MFSLDLSMPADPRRFVLMTKAERDLTYTAALEAHYEGLRYWDAMKRYGLADGPGRWKPEVLAVAG